MNSELTVGDAVSAVLSLEPCRSRGDRCGDEATLRGRRRTGIDMAGRVSARKPLRRPITPTSPALPVHPLRQIAATWFSPATPAGNASGSLGLSTPVLSPHPWVYWRGIDEAGTTGAERLREECRWQRAEFAMGATSGTPWSWKRHAARWTSSALTWLGSGTGLEVCWVSPDLSARSLAGSQSARTRKSAAGRGRLS